MFSESLLVDNLDPGLWGDLRGEVWLGGSWGCPAPGELRPSYDAPSPWSTRSLRRWQRWSTWSLRRWPRGWRKTWPRSRLACCGESWLCGGERDERCGREAGLGSFRWWTWVTVLVKTMIRFLNSVVVSAKDSSNDTQGEVGRQRVAFVKFSTSGNFLNQSYWKSARV